MGAKCSTDASGILHELNEKLPLPSTVSDSPPIQAKSILVVGASTLDDQF